MVSETKLDSKFPASEFTISCYRLFRKDRNQLGGGLIFYVNEYIPCKTINTFNFPNSLEVARLEINFREKKLVIGCYKPPSLNDEYFFGSITRCLKFLQHYIG